MGTQHEKISLSDCDWAFAGYLGEEWRFRNAWLTQETTRPWTKGSVPGSVHWDLVKAGQIQDPYLGLQSLHAEWVSERNWVYRTTFEVPEAWADRRTFLVFEGIDYAAELFVDGTQIGEMCSLFVPATFELDLAPGTHDIAIAIDEKPREEPQIGRSSEVMSRKPRMSYGWDFAPRLVHLGIWQPVRLVSTGAVRIDDLWVRPTVEPASSSAMVDVHVTLADPAPAATRLDVVIGRDGVQDVTVSCDAAAGEKTVVVSTRIDDATLWWPNGMGDQPLYDCRVTVHVGDDESDAAHRTFGLRTVRLVHNAGDDGPRTDALPYTFEVNGRPFYAKGWNWVPVDSMYGRPDLDERYTELVDLAEAAHVNLLRIWGGGLIERELFYDLCDRAGILVWQEFVQSSSGIDNDPNADAEHVAALAAEAAGIVRTRRNHPSLAMWCGGNELAVGEEMIPVTVEHPNIAALAAVVAEHDPDRPFLSSTPSGPIFFLRTDRALERPQDHHQVHGPWDYDGPVRSYAPYNASPALFHSEFGTMGAASTSSLRRFVPPGQEWPPDDTNPVYPHHGSWWLQRPWIERVFGAVDDLDTYVLLTQWQQADVLPYALDANRRRWPVCSGSIPWQLNEPWPNAHCTSSIDYYRRPKPAYWSVRAVYAPFAASLRHDGLALDGAPLRAGVWVVSDDEAGGSVTVSAHRLDGEVVRSERFEVAPAAGSREVGTFDLDLADLPDDVVVVRVDSETGDARSIRRHYAFSRRAESDEPLRPLREVAATKLSAEVASGRVTVRNDGSSIAPLVVLDVDDDTVSWRATDNATLLLPGESWTVDVSVRRRTQAVGPHSPTVTDAPPPTELDIAVRSWNAEALSVTIPLAR